MPIQEQSGGLIERLANLMYPLSERGHGPDHDRLRALYLVHLEQCIGDPFEQALRAVLQELLPPYIQNIQTLQDPSADSSQAIVYARNAIGALATFICRLEEQNYAAAAVSLEAASQALQKVQNLLLTTRFQQSSTAML